MSNENEFSKEEIDRVIKSFTLEEKEKLANEYKNSIKDSKQLVTGCKIFGLISLLASIIILIVTAVLKDFDTMKIAYGLLILAGGLLCLAIYFKSKVKNFSKSTDEILYDFIVNGLNNKSKWCVERMKQVKEKIALPYPEFHIDKNIEICSRKFEYLLVDEVREEFIIKKSLKYSRRYSFKNVLSYKNLENSVSLSENAATGALIGGLFGARGAIRGALFGATETCNSMKIVIVLKNLTEPQITLDLLSGSIKKASAEYKSAQQRMIEITSVLQYILNKRAED